MKGRIEAILKVVGGMKTWYRREKGHVCCNGEGAMVTEKCERWTNRQSNTWGKQISIAICLESKLVKFLEFFQ